MFKYFPFPYLLQNAQNVSLNRLFGKFMLVSVLLCLTINAYSEHLLDSERQLKVKAAFVINLVRFSQWRSKNKVQKRKTIDLCLYQYNLLHNSLDSIVGKKIKYREIRSKIIKTFRIPEQCDIILIPPMALKEFLEFNTTENLQNSITITDLSQNSPIINSLENKIIFRLIRENSRLSFEVNKTAADKLNIGIGSELMKLGKIVSEPDRNHP